jgi:hypothetical protein
MKNEMNSMPENLGSTDHKMFHEHVKQHGAGHKHHKEEFMKHSAGHMYEQDRVRAMCSGGMAKGKK